MGMYTGVRFKGYIKPEFRDNFEEIALSGDWLGHPDPLLAEFGTLARSGFIPCGILCYMPEQWESQDGTPTEGFETTYDAETGYWTFQCSLKNYGDEIEHLFFLMPHFVEKIEHLEYFYEEWDYSKLFILNPETNFIELEYSHYRRYNGSSTSP